MEKYSNNGYSVWTRYGNGNGERYYSVIHSFSIPDSIFDLQSSIFHHLSLFLLLDLGGNLIVYCLLLLNVIDYYLLASVSFLCSFPSILYIHSLHPLPLSLSLLSPSRSPLTYSSLSLSLILPETPSPPHLRLFFSFLVPGTTTLLLLLLV